MHRRDILDSSQNSIILKCGNMGKSYTFKAFKYCLNCPNPFTSGVLTELIEYSFIHFIKAVPYVKGKHYLV